MINKDQLQRTLEIETNNIGKNNEDTNTLEIIQMMGGIDQIVQDCLSQQISDLDQECLDKIEKIINAPTVKANPLKRHVITTNVTNNINIDIDTIDYKTSQDCNNADFIYVFDKHNTHLHKYFPKKEKKIKKVFDSIFVKCALVLSIIVYNVLTRFHDYTLGSIYHPIYSISFSSLLWIPYCVYIILSINRNGFRLILKTFEFKFKIFVSASHFIAIYLDYFVLNINTWHYLFPAIIERLLFGIMFCLVVVGISCYDALHISVRWKVLIASMVAAVATLWSVWSLFVVTNHKSDTYDFVNYSLIQIGPYIAVSLTSLEISTMRILAIFIWRQAICSFLFNRSVLIKTKPYIIWTTHKQTIATKQLYNSDNDKNAMEIIQIIGGMDKIVSHYKKREDIVLNQDKLDKICTLNTNHKPSAFSKAQVYYYFRSTDSFSYALFGENIRRKLNDIFFSKTLKITFCLGMIIYIICRFGARFYDDTTDYFAVFLMIQMIIVTLIAIPYAIFFILSFNRYAFKYIASGFEFWLKLLYAIVYVTASSVHNLYLNPSENHPKYMRSWQILVGIWYILGVIIVSSLDTIQLDRKWKLIILTPACVIVSLWTLFLMFGVIANEDERDTSMVSITPKYAVSLLMLQISGIRVVAIFFWKQLFSSFRHPNQAASIVETPVIEWKHD